jgi:hypothetical protein
MRIRRPSFSGVQGKIVRNTQTQTAARTLAHDYYRVVHPHLTQLATPTDALARLDGPIRKLLEVSSVAAKRTTYAACLAKIRRAYNEITPLRESKLGTNVTVLTPIESRIIETLEKLKPSAASSYQQALIDLSGSPRHSYRGSCARVTESSAKHSTTLPQMLM